MRRLLICFVVLFLLGIYPAITCLADELAPPLQEASGADKLPALLDESSRTLLEQAGVSGVEDALEFSWEGIFSVAGQLLREKYLFPLRNLLISAAIIIISSFLASYNSDSKEFSELAGALAICAITLPCITGLIADAKVVCEGVSVFLLSAIPVYGGLMIAAGNLVAGSTYGSVSIIGANLISQLAEKVIIPSLSIFAGLSVSSAFSHINIRAVTETIYKFVKWLMVFAITAFSGIISVQSVISGATDAASLKTARLVASTAIPIVGGAFSDGVTAVQHSLKILKSGAGAFGILATLMIFLTPVIQTLLWMCSAQGAILVADLFAAGKIKDFLNVILLVLKMILAVLLSLCLISIVTAAITLFVGL